MKPVFGITPPPTRRFVGFVTPEQAADIVTTGDFQGETYERERDHDRLAVQLGAVRRLMSDGKARTLREISEATGAPEASVSARLRDLRKQGRTVEREYVSRGLFQYRVMP